MFTTRKIQKLKIGSLDLVWVAGLLEGEGTFTPHRQKRKSKKTQKVRRSSQPRVQFQTQDKDVADKLAALLGHHVLGPYSQKRTKRPTFSSDEYKACYEELQSVSRRYSIWKYSGFQSCFDCVGYLPVYGTAKKVAD